MHVCRYADAGADVHTCVHIFQIVFLYKLAELLGNSCTQTKNHTSLPVDFACTKFTIVLNRHYLNLSVYNFYDLGKTDNYCNCKLFDEFFYLFQIFYKFNI